MSAVLKILFVAIVAVHGLIHLMGFAKAFKYADLEQLTQPISKPFGLLWLTSTGLFLLTIPLYLTRIDWWWVVALAAIIVSQIVILFSWQDAKFGTIANVLILIAIAFEVSKMP